MCIRSSSVCDVGLNILLRLDSVYILSIKQSAASVWLFNANRLGNR